MTELSPAAKALLNVLLGPEKLSPAAQSTVDAFWKDLDFREDFTLSNIGAALRAAVDQVIPENGDMPLNMAHRLSWDARQQVRQQLLAIATELESAQ
jgi:hypothetical protein